MKVVPEKDRKPNDVFANFPYEVQSLVVKIGVAWLREHMPAVVLLAENDPQGPEGVFVALMNKGAVEVVIIQELPDEMLTPAKDRSKLH